jgi:hypothetical protein
MAAKAEAEKEKEKAVAAAVTTAKADAEREQEEAVAAAVMAAKAEAAEEKVVAVAAANVAAVKGNVKEADETNGSGNGGERQQGVPSVRGSLRLSSGSSDQSGPVVLCDALKVFEQDACVHCSFAIIFHFSFS